jgi:hypothetical protein
LNPVKKNVVIGNATHFAPFEKPRCEIFNEIRCRPEQVQDGERMMIFLAAR